MRPWQEIVRADSADVSRITFTPRGARIFHDFKVQRDAIGYRGRLEAYDRRSLHSHGSKRGIPASWPIVPSVFSFPMLLYFVLCVRPLSDPPP